MKELTENDFDLNVLSAPGPIVVDFYTPNCPPCRNLAAVLDELDRQHLFKITFFKVDASQWPTIAARFRIQTVPTLIAFHNGQAIGQLTGMGVRPQVCAWLSSYVKTDSRA